MKNLDFGRCALCICAAAAMLAACGGSQPPIGAPGAVPQVPDHKKHSKTFEFTGAAQSFVVPESVTAITVTASGASGHMPRLSRPHDLGTPGHRLGLVWFPRKRRGQSNDLS